MSSASAIRDKEVAELLTGINCLSDHRGYLPVWGRTPDGSYTAFAYRVKYFTPRLDLLGSFSEKEDRLLVRIHSVRGALHGGHTPPTIEFATDLAPIAILHPTLIGGWWGYTDQDVAFERTAGPGTEPQPLVHVAG